MTAHHLFLPAVVLQRKAVVYVRQSTPQQVQLNLESQRRQYELVGADVDAASPISKSSTTISVVLRVAPSNDRASIACCRPVRWTGWRGALSRGLATRAQWT